MCMCVLVRLAADVKLKATPLILSSVTCKPLTNTTALYNVDIMRPS